MTQVRRSTLGAVVFATALAVGVGLCGAGAEPTSNEIEDLAKQKEREVNQIRAYLDLHYSEKGMHWDLGPVRVIADAVAKAYKDRTFYYVHSRQFPVAMSNKVSVCLSIDGDGNVLAHDGALTGRDKDMLAFCNDSLVEAKDERSATIAGAAIMCLILTHAGPQTVGPEEATATRTEDGWTCEATLGNAPRSG